MGSPSPHYGKLGTLQRALGVRAFCRTILRRSVGKGYGEFWGYYRGGLDVMLLSLSAATQFRWTEASASSHHSRYQKDTWHESNFTYQKLMLVAV